MGTAGKGEKNVPHTQGCTSLRASFLGQGPVPAAPWSCAGWELEPRKNRWQLVPRELPSLSHALGIGFS